MTIPLPILLHLGFASAAMVAVPLALLLPRLGLAGHRPLGRLAALAMAGTALSALLVARDGASPLHLLALVLLLTLARAVVMVRRGRVAAHRRMMLIAAASLYVAGGAAILIPGRMAHRLIFG
jgi:uncharacterized membrane protein